MQFETEISAVHPDIIQTHILSRLDGQTLASAGCSSSLLLRLSSQDDLWCQICNETWPSTAQPRLRSLISAFPAGHRSFFSDSFPTLHRHIPTQKLPRSPSPNPEYLISAVDLRYKDALVLSKAHESETKSGWFLSSPFRVDLIEPKETVPAPAKFHGGEDDTCRTDLEDNLTLSWILVDPYRNRAANFSSLRPVSVRRHWLTGDLLVRYATISAGNQRGDLVQWEVTVTCGGKGGELHVKEVYLQVEDMEGRNLSGKESLVILQDAMEAGKRRKAKAGEAKQSYEDYQRMKRERRERKQRREKSLDLVCMATAVTIFLAWAFLLVRTYR
ncbi:hypothetical protein NMG60_11033423 [Bertholletia excelsa]